MKLTVETTDAATAVKESAYLVALKKIIRGLKKKLEKAKKTEGFRAAGKRLNVEQIKLLETKPLIEATLADNERVRLAIEAVAKDLEEKEKQEKEAIIAPSASATTPTPSPKPVPASKTEVVAAISLPSTECHAPPMPIPAPESEVVTPTSIPTTEHDALPMVVIAPKSEVIPDTSILTTERDASASSEDVDAREEPLKKAKDSSVCGAKEHLLREHVSVQTDYSGPPPPQGLDPTEVATTVATAAALAAHEKAIEEAEARGLAAGRAEMTAGLTKIMRLLHVTTRYEARGKPLPSALGFFSNVLLGKALRPDEKDFDGCVDFSVQRAALYLHNSDRSREVAPGTTLNQLDESVASVQDEIIAIPSPEGPILNFFADTSPGESVRDDSAASSRSPSPNENCMPQPFGPTPIAEGGEDVAAHQAPSPKAPEPPHSGQSATVLPMPRPEAPTQGVANGVDVSVPTNPALKHNAVQGVDKRSHESGSLGRQASQMEEGVLPPVVKQEQAVRPSAVAANGDSVPPKHERHDKPRARGPPPPPPYSPPFSPCTSGCGGGYVVAQPRNFSPPLVHQQQVRSPFIRHLSPPLTPLQSVQVPGHHIPSPSPPAHSPATSQSLPPGGLTNTGFHGGWGYPPQAPQHAIFVQHHPCAPQMHAAPTHMHRGPAARAPWGREEVLSPSYQYPRGISPSSRTANGPHRASANGQTHQNFANGFNLSPSQAGAACNSPHAMMANGGPAPLPTGSRTSGYPSGFTPSVHHSPPVNPLQGSPPPLPLEHGQRQSGEVEVRPGMVCETRDRMIEGLPVPGQQMRPVESTCEHERMVAVGVKEDTEDTKEQEHPIQENAVVPPVASMVSSAKAATSPVSIANGTVNGTVTGSTARKIPVDSTATTSVNGDATGSTREVRKDSPVPAGDGIAGNSRSGGNAKGRRSNARARAAKKVETKNAALKDGDDHTQQKFVSNVMSDSSSSIQPSAVTSSQQGPVELRQRQDAAPRNGRGQRGSREQGRGQPLPRQDRGTRPQQREQFQVPVAAQDQAAQAPGHNNRRAVLPQQSRRRGVPRSQTLPASGVVPVPVNGPSPAPALKVPSLTPVSMSWADEVPSPRAQPSKQQQHQRVNGGGRNRHTSQQRSLDSERQGHGNENSHDPVASHDARNSQHIRNTHRYRQGRGHVSNRGVTGSRPRETPHNGVNGQKGYNDRAFPERQGRSEHGLPRANEGLPNGNLGASQGTGNRKSRAVPSQRRRGGGNGGDGGRVLPQHQHQNQQRAS